MSLGRSSQFLIVFAGIACVICVAQPAHAIDPASVGIRTFDADFQQVGDIPVLITYLSGQYPVEPLLIFTEPVGLVWNSVPPNTYLIVALDDDFEPIPASEIVLTAPPGAHDIVVNLLLPPTCPADLDDSGTVDAGDLALLLGAWGPNPGHNADLDGDGAVNAADLAALLGNWGECL